MYSGINCFFFFCFNGAPAGLYAPPLPVGLPASIETLLRVNMSSVISTNDSHYVVML